jgi:hypothetical protein
LLQSGGDSGIIRADVEEGLEHNGGRLLVKKMFFAALLVFGDVSIDLLIGDATSSNCDLCLFSGDGQCDEPAYCPYGTDCDCNRTATTFNNHTVNTIPLHTKYRADDTKDLTVGIVAISTSLMMLIALAFWNYIWNYNQGNYGTDIEKYNKKIDLIKEWQKEFEKRLALIPGVTPLNDYVTKRKKKSWMSLLCCIVGIGSIAFTIVFSQTQKPFAGDGPKRQSREDLLFSPVFPLASYCGYNISANTTTGDESIEDDALKFVPFHDAVALVALVIISSLILPEMGIAKMKDKKEEQQRLLRIRPLDQCGFAPGTEIRKFFAQIFSCCESKEEEEDERDYYAEYMEDEALDADEGDQSESEGHQRHHSGSGRLSQFLGESAAVQTEKMMQAAKEGGEGLKGYVSSAFQMVSTNDTQSKEDDAVEQGCEKAQQDLKQDDIFKEKKPPDFYSTSYIGNFPKVVKLIESVTNAKTGVSCGRVCLQLCGLLGRGCCDVLPVLTSAGQLVAFAIGLYAYWRNVSGANSNCNYIISISMVYFKPILLPWCKLVIASVRQSGHKVPDSGDTIAFRHRATDKSTIENIAARCSNGIGWVLGAYQSFASGVIDRISGVSTPFMISILLVTGLVLLPLVLLPIAFYTSGFYAGESYVVVTQWLLWYLKDMWRPGELDFSLNFKVCISVGRHAWMYVCGCM